MADLSNAQLEERINDLEGDLEILSEEVEKLKSRKQPGRKKVPLKAPRQAGVCAIDPECDSAQCENNSVYRYQQGCRGTACVEENRRYYAKYRAEKAQSASTNGH